MKMSRVVFLVLVSFVLGYLARTGIEHILWEHYRTSREQQARRAFPIGEAFDKIAAPLRERGLHLEFEPAHQRYVAPLAPDSSAKLWLYVEVDEKQRIKSVRVKQVFILQ